jgi:hypothetical protein
VWIDSSSIFHSYTIWLVKGPIRWHFHLWFPSSLWGCFRIKRPHWANGGRSWHTLSGKFLAMLWEIESIWGSSLDRGIPKHSQSLDQCKKRAFSQSVVVDLLTVRYCIARLDLQPASKTWPGSMPPDRALEWMKCWYAVYPRSILHRPRNQHPRSTIATSWWRFSEKTWYDWYW